MKLNQIRNNKSNNISKEKIYSDLSRFLSNCEKVDLDFDLLIGANLAKYLNLTYLILLEVNDTSSIGYNLILPRIKKLAEICKSRILTFV